jgi:hypothetical protein
MRLSTKIAIEYVLIIAALWVSMGLVCYGIYGLFTSVIR